MKFLFLQGEEAMGIHSWMKKVLEDDSLSYSKAKTWVPKFLTGHFEVMDKPGLEQLTPTTMEDESHIMHIMILKEYCILAKFIAGTGDFL